nr:Unknown Function [uncultured bacterium]
MKAASFLMFAAGLFVSNAQAAMTCFNLTSTDTGYALEVSANRESVVVKKMTISGTTDVATLPCTRMTTDPLKVVPGADALNCRRTDVVDSGFTATIKGANCAGQVEAKLEEQSIVGPRLVAELICVDAP